LIIKDISVIVYIDYFVNSQWTTYAFRKYKLKLVFQTLETAPASVRSLGFSLHVAHQYVVHW